MTKTLLKLAVGVVIAASAVTSVAAAKPHATPPQVQGGKLALVISADTVQGAGGSPAPEVGCSMTNLFRQGQIVVFRMWGVDVKLNGVALTPAIVKSAVVKIPGLTAPLKFAYGPHGTGASAVSFWTVPFPTKGYPLGIVNFQIIVKTKAVKRTSSHPAIKSLTGTYSQKGFSPTSQLTITP